MRCALGGCRARGDPAHSKTRGSRLCRSRGGCSLNAYRDFSADIQEVISEPTGAWWRDPETIPPREFLHGRHYIRGAVSATIAGGGRGKTSLATYEAVCMAVGRNVATGQHLPGGPLSVGIVNGEEDQNELDRRVAAICQRFR